MAELEDQGHERIVAAAVHAYGATWSLPRPARHGDVLFAIDQAGLCALAHGPDSEGFLTSEGRFVGRLEAADIAVKAGQTDAPKWPPRLFSEDLW